MIYTNEANFRLETKWHSTVPWVTSFCHIIWAHTLLSGDRSPILRDASNRLLNTHKFPKIHSVMMKTMEVRESFRRSMKKWSIRLDSIVYLWFRTLEVVLFPHNTTARESWIKVTILVGGRCQDISNKSKYQIRAFRLCFPHIPHFLPEVYFYKRCWLVLKLMDVFHVAFQVVVCESFMAYHTHFLLPPRTHRHVTVQPVQLCTQLTWEWRFGLVLHPDVVS